jgi:hypothetical protein
MKWSQLKKTIESFICPTLRNRVKFYSTRYRSTHDQVGRAWISVDGKEIYDFSTPTWINEYYGTAHRIRIENNALDFQDPIQAPGYYDAYKEAGKYVEEKGIFEQYCFYRSIEEYINLPFDEALMSENKIIKSIALIDRRLGKRRLKHIQLNDDEINLYKILYYLRMESEGLKVR